MGERAAFLCLMSQNNQCQSWEPDNLAVLDICLMTTFQYTFEAVEVQRLRRGRALLCLLLWVIWSNWSCLMYVLNWGSSALLPQSDTGFFKLRKWSFPHRCRCLLDKAENRQMCLSALGKRCGEGANTRAEKIPWSYMRGDLEAFPARKILKSKETCLLER